MMTPRPTCHRRLVRLGVAAFAALSLLVGATAAQADTRDDLLRQQQQNDAERERLESSLEGVDTDLAETYLALEDAKARLPIARQELTAAEEALAAAERKQQQFAGRLELAEAELATLDEEITASEADIESTRSAMGELARSTYRGDHAVSSLEVVLESSSTEEFLDSYSVRESAVRAQTQVLDELETASAIARNQQERQDAVTERIGELKVEADAAVVEADVARDAAAEREAEIEQIEAEMSELAGQLEAKKDEFSGAIAELEASTAELAREIAEIDEANRRAEEERRRREAEEERRAGASRSQQQRSAPAPAPAAPQPVPSGNLLTTPVPRPLYVTSPYGYRVYPITGGWFMHKGVDIRSSCGNPQVAAAGGTVVSTKPPWQTGTSGNQVIVNHGMLGGDSYVTVYNHLSRFAVSPGQQVSQGQAIGYTGDTGNVTGCHVHFEVYKNGSTIDPMSLPGF